MNISPPAFKNYYFQIERNPGRSILAHITEEGQLIMMIIRI